MLPNMNLSILSPLLALPLCTMTVQVLLCAYMLASVCGTEMSTWQVENSSFIDEHIAVFRGIILND